jgi:dihydropteroate synthase
MFWQTARWQIDLSRPRVMGIVNVTPDSFSDGGQHHATRDALTHCEQLIKDGADILDIGAESTRPGATPVGVELELERLIPVIQAASSMGVAISVDTYKPQVMQAALDAGADILNDIWGFRQLGSLQVVAAHPNCGLCTMHMHGEPITMQSSPMQGDVTLQVQHFLQTQAAWLVSAGVNASRICLDPGYGFGKTVNQNFTLLAQQQQIADLGFPVLAGWSRKSSLGVVTGCEVHERLIPSVTAAVLAAERGAHVLRVHDVKETCQALKVWQALKSANLSQSSNSF